MGGPPPLFANLNRSKCHCNRKCRVRKARYREMIMSDRNFQSASAAYFVGGLTSFGGWKPPSNETVSAALGLAITACVALRLALEAPRNGNILGGLISSGNVQTAAAILISHFRPS
jgi:hypothetical protein